MGMLSPKNDKGANKGKKQIQNNAQGSKFITKPGNVSPFVKKKITTSAKRGS
jgi:hypothetical protein